MLVRDVMTVGVVSVAPDTPVKEIATLLLRAGISGVPVTDEGRVVGVVSESDILPLRNGLPGHPVGTAADVMTRELITLVEEMSVTEAARVLERHRIKRAPVMRREQLVGIVTRADLLRPYLRTDSAILAEVEESLIEQGLHLDPWNIDVRVDQGVVTLEGPVVDERARALMVRLTCGVDGVVDVVNRLWIAASEAPARAAS